jgi:DNA polymerase III epsilon subunit-like protein
LESLIAFDVETPNHRNDRISAIGITVIENGVITQSVGTLVNPETYFDPFNIALTGITPEAVRSALTFDRLWERIGDAFCGNILLAHNAPFDMGVLSKCIADYGMAAPDTLRYACTCNMARRFFPRMEHHGLADLCCWYGVSLDHHKADSDARACAEILLRYVEDGFDIRPFYRRYDVRLRKTLPFCDR